MADTIVAEATPPGKGGIGIVRVSGDLVPKLAEKIFGRTPQPRMAELGDFCSTDGEVLDSGIALYFPSPNSFTGEHVLEIQGHGGPVVMQMLVETCIELGARQARPGEFSERAFLNDKIDLSQAEAIADLIDSMSIAAAKGAIRSLQGKFSKKINDVVAMMLRLRVYVEAAIDFPEEEVDFLSDGKVSEMLNEIRLSLAGIAEQAGQGAMLKEGVSLVLMGRPNAGKSSLMNALSGEETSIVTSLAGTTRDIVDERINLGGLPIRIVDTAGLREPGDEIEAEGVRRTKNAVASADHVLIVVDMADREPATTIDSLTAELDSSLSFTVALNKVDLVPVTGDLPSNQVGVSALTGEGLEMLKERLQSSLGYMPREAHYSARTRHVIAIKSARQHVDAATAVLVDTCAGELVAEELKLASIALGEVTGEVSSDALLGEIFSSFCIGK